MNHRGEDCIDRFLDDLSLGWQMLKPDTFYDIHWTVESRRKHATANMCHICYVEFSNEIIKHADHDHTKLLDNYRASLCFKCNSQIRV